MSFFGGGGGGGGGGGVPGIVGAVYGHWLYSRMFLHNFGSVFQFACPPLVFQTQMPISLVVLVISLQDLYMTKYKYAVTSEMGI